MKIAPVQGYARKARTDAGSVAVKGKYPADTGFVIKTQQSYSFAELLNIPVVYECNQLPMFQRHRFPYLTTELGQHEG